MKNRAECVFFESIHTCELPFTELSKAGKLIARPCCVRPPGRAISDAVPNFHSWSARSARSCSPRRARGKLSRRWINCFRGREGRQAGKATKASKAGGGGDLFQNEIFKSFSTKLGKLWRAGEPGSEFPGCQHFCSVVGIIS